MAHGVGGYQDNTVQHVHQPTGTDLGQGRERMVSLVNKHNCIFKDVSEFAWLTMCWLTTGKRRG